jgi:hypothetical protein
MYGENGSVEQALTADVQPTAAAGLLLLTLTETFTIFAAAALYPRLALLVRCIRQPQIGCFQQHIINMNAGFMDFRLSGVKFQKIVVVE